MKLRKAITGRIGGNSSSLNGVQTGLGMGLGFRPGRLDVGGRYSSGKMSWSVQRNPVRTSSMVLDRISFLPALSRDKVLKGIFVCKETALKVVPSNWRLMNLAICFFTGSLMQTDDGRNLVPRVIIYFEGRSDWKKSMAHCPSLAV